MKKRSHPAHTRLALLLLILSLIFSSQTFTLALTTDAPSDWAQAEVDLALSKGLITAEANGNFQTNISRRLFCALVVNMVETILSEPVAITITNPFQDTNEESIIKAYQLGIVYGVTTTQFAPANQITREQIAVMLLRAARKMDELKRTAYAYAPTAQTVTFADQAQISGWALQDVQAASALGIMQGVGANKINPLGNTTVEQGILLINRLYDGFVALLPDSTPADPPPTEPVIPINQAPVALANPVPFTVKEQTALSITAAQLVTDANDDLLTIVRVNGQVATYNTTYGTVTIQPDGSCVYTSRDITASINDDFVVTVSDGTAETHVNVRIAVSHQLILTITPSLTSVSVSGTTSLNETLSAGLISYLGSPTTPATLSYQWMKSNSLNGTYTNIEGATNSSYKIIITDVGSYIKLKVTASGSAGGSATSTAKGAISYGFAAGSGTLASPYQIANTKQFLLLNDIPTEGIYFKLTSELSLAKDTMITKPFYGVFDGNNHSININLAMTTNYSEVGLFNIIGKTASFTGQVTKLRISGIVNLTSTKVGALAGINYGSISHCLSTANITAFSYTGGLVGYNFGSINRCGVLNSYVTGTDDVMGGLVGKNDSTGTITNSYARTHVTGISNVGGLVGWNRGQIQYTFAAGIVDAEDVKGGLVGLNDSTVSASYYDKTLNGLTDSNRGLPRTTAQMMTQSTYVTWDFTTIWSLETTPYPYLRP